MGGKPAVFDIIAQPSAVMATVGQVFQNAGNGGFNNISRQEQTRSQPAPVGQWNPDKVGDRDLRALGHLHNTPNLD